MIEAIGIVVPAHNEQATLPACLVALGNAVRHPALRTLAVHLVPVLDACSDDSGELVAAAAPLEVTGHNVGLARAAGFGEVLRREAGRDPATIWLASTDADTLVPPGWLAGQLGYANAGWEVVAGTVAVADWREQPSAVRRRYAAHYQQRSGHPHVHGANLGLSAAAYLHAGGVPPLALAEDQALVDLLGAHRLLRTAALPVTTSARREGRTTGGFSKFLRELSD